MTIDDTYDPECERFADHFLGDLLPESVYQDGAPALVAYEALRRSFAIEIQQAVDSWFASHEAAIALFKATHG